MFLCFLGGGLRDYGSSSPLKWEYMPCRDYPGGFGSDGILKSGSRRRRFSSPVREVLCLAVLLGKRKRVGLVGVKVEEHRNRRGELTLILNAHSAQSSNGGRRTLKKSERAKGCPNPCKTSFWLAFKFLTNSPCAPDAP